MHQVMKRLIQLNFDVSPPGPVSITLKPPIGPTMRGGMCVIDVGIVALNLACSIIKSGLVDVEDDMLEERELVGRLK